MKKGDRQKQVKKLEKKERTEIRKEGAVIEEDIKPEKGMMKIDLHCHTEASWDCITDIEKIPDRLIEQEIKVQAITDHNEIWGAIKLKEIVEKKDYDLTIVIGEEILTSEGEIIGLFIQKRIPKLLNPKETIKRIKAQGGLVLLPHGFDPLKRYRLSPDARKSVADDIDLVETFNTRVSRRRWNQSAVNYSRDKNKLMSAGSDAHTLKDIGSAWVEVPERKIAKPEDLLKALENGTPTGTWTNPVRSLMYRGWDMVRNVVYTATKSA